MTRSLTPRQQNVLDFIVKTMNELGYPPTRAEISRALGFRSPNAAEEHLRALERKGVIRVIRGTSRGIRLPAQEHDTQAVGDAPEIPPPPKGCRSSAKWRPAARSSPPSILIATAHCRPNISLPGPITCCGFAAYPCRTSAFSRVICWPCIVPSASATADRGGTARG